MLVFWVFSTVVVLTTALAPRAEPSRPLEPSHKHTSRSLIPQREYGDLGDTSIPADLCLASRGRRARSFRQGKIHAIANRGLSPNKVAPQRYYRETTTCPTWNGGGAASGLRDTAPGARQQLQGDDIVAAARAHAAGGRRPRAHPRRVKWQILHEF